MKITPSLFLAATALLATGCADMLPGRSSATPIAVAELKPTEGNNVSGTTTFTRSTGQILVDARIKGLTPGAHGFHIHEKGDCSAPDATSAGGHFNPDAKPHGSHNAPDRHAGDLGNLVADANGDATLKIAIPMTGITMEKEGASSIIGKGLIVHADPDDYKTQPTGNSGKRVACGVISLK